MSMATEGWGTTLTFKMRAGTHALFCVNVRDVYLLWLNSDGLAKTHVLGSSTYETFVKNANGSITVTCQANATMTAFYNPA